MSDEALDILCDNLRKGNLTAFLGAGISRTFNDESNGKTYRGMPTASEVLDSVRSKKKYIPDGLSFDQAFFLVKEKESRSVLQQLICGYYDAAGAKPLPAHTILASLPFKSYVTTNFDLLLEKALEKQRKRYAEIIEDEDVPGWNSNTIPIIKYHGSITRPATLIAAEDEYTNLEKREEIVAAFIKTLFSNKPLLFLGFALADRDFKALFEDTRIILGSHMLKSYAVVHSASGYEKDYWKSQGVEIIESDATDFLRKLEVRYRMHGRPPLDAEEWTSISFFKSLHIINFPTETQAINAFLENLLEEISNTESSCDDIHDRADAAVKKVLEHKQNFHALQGLWSSMSPTIASLPKTNHMEAKRIIEEALEGQNKSGKQISRKWDKVVKKADSILLYSQSIRMLDLLKEVRAPIQETCQLFVCECRPKSTWPFEDAKSVCSYLSDTGYKITIIPDVAFANLMYRKQIKSVIMGAHSLYKRDGNYTSFVNTCGSSLIVHMAKLYDIPVYITAESSKCIELLDDDIEEVSYEEEQNIFEAFTDMDQLNTEHLTEINSLNIGYDLCPFLDNITVICDD
jgi:translation initiation factor 2B subunit (eIF-2B alpha/beta/delta family)